MPPRSSIVSRNAAASTGTGNGCSKIGPGSDLSTGAIMLDRGAAGYLAVDLFDNRAQAHPDLYRRLGEALDREVREDELGFALASFPDLPEIEGEYDLIVSNATLEHVQNVGYLFRRLRGLASTRARMVHHIDAQTHMRWIKDTDPLNILRFPDMIYRNLLDFPGAPNRLRARDFERLAGMAGWASTRVVRGRRAPEGYVSRTRVNRRFRAYDLDALHVHAAGRALRPAATGSAVVTLAKTDMQPGEVSLGAVLTFEALEPVDDHLCPQPVVVGKGLDRRRDGAGDRAIDEQPVVAVIDKLG